MSEPYKRLREVSTVAGYGGYCVRTVQCTHKAFLHDLDSFKHISQFLELQASDFNFETIVISLAFQRRIPNSSTVKTREATV